MTSQPLSLAAASASRAPDANGQQVALFSHEVRLAERVESFWHVTRRITGQSGLRANSQLNVEFDPSYQTLVFHYVDVQRGATRINQLDPRAVKLVQREPDLESQIFDSRQSALLFLSDLRVGDVVDYAYSIAGSDPTLAGTFDQELLLGLPVPVDHFFARVVTHENRWLGVSQHGPSSVPDPALAPHVNQDSTEFRWDLFATKAYAVESQTPSWFDQLPVARISSFTSWHEVALWGGRFFSPAHSLSGPASAWAEEQVRQGTIENFIVRAARFVQDEIRYVAIEVGIARRQPSDPNLTFQRRYGDCKDKTALLVALLRTAKLEADPVLVSSTHGLVLDENAPSGAVFDHAIVRVKVAGKSYFIDPTNAWQGGGVERFLHSSFGRVLVLDGSFHLQALTPEPQDEPSVSVSDHLVLPLPSSHAEATFATLRTYRGLLADLMRSQLRAMAKDQLSKTYLSIYQPDYPDIHELTPIDEVDDREQDVIRVRANFGLPNPWAPNARELSHAAKVSARSLEWLLPSPSSNARATPLGTSFPLRGRHSIEIALPFDLPAFSSAPERITTNASSFSFEAAYVNRHLTYTYEVDTRARAVAPEDMPQQRSAVEKALTLMQRTVIFRDGMADAGLRGVNWLMALLGLLVLAGSGVISVWAFRAKKTIANTRTERGPPVRFGGWLVLLGFGVTAAPFLFAFSCFRKMRVLLSLSRWQALATPELASYRPGLAILLVSETTFALIMCCYSLAVAVAFVKKLRSFPWHFTVFGLSMIAFGVIDCVALSFVRETSTGFASMFAAGQSVVSGAIWILYLRNSRRVALTFTRGPRKPRRTKRSMVSPEVVSEGES